MKCSIQSHLVVTLMAISIGSVFAVHHRGFGYRIHKASGAVAEKPALAAEPVAQNYEGEQQQQQQQPSAAAGDVDESSIVATGGMSRDDLDLLQRKVMVGTASDQESQFYIDTIVQNAKNKLKKQNKKKNQEDGDKIGPVQMHQLVQKVERGEGTPEETEIVETYKQEKQEKLLAKIRKAKSRRQKGGGEKSRKSKTRKSKKKKAIKIETLLNSQIQSDNSPKLNGQSTGTEVSQKHKKSKKEFSITKGTNKKKNTKTNKQNPNSNSKVKSTKKQKTETNKSSMDSTKKNDGEKLTKTNKNVSKGSKQSKQAKSNKNVSKHSKQSTDSTSTKLSQSGKKKANSKTTAERTQNNIVGSNQARNNIKETGSTKLSRKNQSKHGKIESNAPSAGGQLKQAEEKQPLHEVTNEDFVDQFDSDILQLESKRGGVKSTQSYKNRHSTNLKSLKESKTKEKGPANMHPSAKLAKIRHKGSIEIDLPQQAEVAHEIESAASLENAKLNDIAAKLKAFHFKKKR